jgi:hypothetical protein
MDTPLAKGVSSELLFSASHQKLTAPHDTEDSVRAKEALEQSAPIAVKESAKVVGESSDTEQLVRLLKQMF